ncbi:hypothetical protein M501DRAFT_992507 [Patellaria atrata CBS 101060]|uniref:Uncharacterized protein n=1 Tax=Patellaria atrata CBS 101060 TaxID=1346257 RepID=A0A9P4SBE9_9PEZI|nr:hypothetical protein M501DRAFT_992507 [Patellaria atrata CBS 101060]
MSFFKLPRNYFGTAVTSPSQPEQPPRKRQRRPSDASIASVEMNEESIDSTSPNSPTSTMHRRAEPQTEARVDGNSVLSSSGPETVPTRNDVNPTANTSRDALKDVGRQLKDILEGLKKQLESPAGSYVDISCNFTVDIRGPCPESYKIVLVHDLDATPSGLDVRVENSPRDSVITLPTPISAGHPAPTPVARFPNKMDLDMMLERDLMSRRKLQQQEEENANKQGGDDGSNTSLKRKRDEEETPAPSRSRLELQKMLENNRDDIQDDTVESVNHLQRLMRRWREQWRDKNAWMFDFFKQMHEEERSKKAWLEERFAALHREIGADLAQPVIEENGSESGSKARLFMELKNLSNQVKWVEDCRRIADASHDKKEDTWRSTSATFHDQMRRQRETYEQWMIQEVKTLRSMLSHVLGEIRALSPVVMSLKWDDPTFRHPAPPPAIPYGAPAPAPPPHPQHSTPRANQTPASKVPLPPSNRTT